MLAAYGPLLLINHSTFGGLFNSDAEYSTDFPRQLCYFSFHCLKLLNSVVWPERGGKLVMRLFAKVLLDICCHMTLKWDHMPEVDIGQVYVDE